MSIKFNKFVERKYKVQLLEYLVNFVQYTITDLYYFQRFPHE